jgi:hypothetical protein
VQPRSEGGFVVRYDGTTEPIDGPDDIAQIIDECAEEPNDRGTHGRTYLLGREGDDGPALRVDLDPDTGAGAVRWLVDDLIGVEPAYEPRVVIVAEEPGAELAWIPPTIARASYGAARAAAVLYVETGRQPGNLDWVDAEH